MRLELRNSGELKCETCGAGQLVTTGNDEEIVRSLEEWAQGLIDEAEMDVVQSTRRHYSDELADRHREIEELDAENQTMAEDVLAAVGKRRWRMGKLRRELEEIVSEFRKQSIRA